MNGFARRKDDIARMKKFIALMLAIPLINGCGGMSDKNTTRAQGAGMGAVLGAGLGAIIGNQMGDSTKGAVIGGLLGAAAGGVYGNHVANKKAQFASQEQYIDACIAQAAQVQQQTYAYNQQLRQDITGLEQQVQQANQAYKQKQMSRDQMVAMKKDLNNRVQQANQSLERVGQEIQIQNQVLANERQAGGSGSHLAKLEQQINALQRQKSELQQQTQRLAALNNSMSV